MLKNFLQTSVCWEESLSVLLLFPFVLCMEIACKELPMAGGCIEEQDRRGNKPFQKGENCMEVVKKGCGYLRH